MASAMPELLSSEQFAFAGSWGNFEGEKGVAFGTRVRLTKNLSVAGGVGAGVDNGTVEGSVSGRVGW